MILRAMIIFCFTLVCLTTISMAKEFSVMTYNAENLFDTIHDQGKEDWSYLPLKNKKISKDTQEYCSKQNSKFRKRLCFDLDWNEAMLSKKVKNLASVLKAYDNGKGADIIVFQEIENINALKLLVKMGLKGMGYKELVLTEGPDKRGIDVGIVSRFPLAAPTKYHNIDTRKAAAMEGKDPRPTRGILEATFRIAGKKVTIFANHWPSQGNPDSYRQEAAKTLRSATLKLKGKAVIATGDFNTLEDDAPHGINNLITNKNLKSHYVDASEEAGHQLKRPGTHWYRGEWSSLDKILVLNTNCNYMTPKWDSLNVVAKEFMFKRINFNGKQTLVPYRFDYNTTEGFSDHLPLVMKFKL